MKDLFFICLLCFCATALAQSIDRRALVERHDVVVEKLNSVSPAQVGNGEFAFSFDATGLQTFIPFNTMAHWAWHSEPLPEGVSVSDFKGVEIESCGVKRIYPTDLNSASGDIKKHPGAFPNPRFSDREALAAKWLKENPHALNLGRLGFEFISKNGVIAKASDMKNVRQTLRLFEGYAQSEFEVFGGRVSVLTYAHPLRDAVCVKVQSSLINEGRLRVFAHFPYGDKQERPFFVGDWKSESRHLSKVAGKSGSSENGFAVLERTLDADVYFARFDWLGVADFSADKNVPHKFYLTPKGESFEFSCEFSKLKPDAGMDLRKSFSESSEAWKAYWLSGAALDFGEVSDPRAAELERRIVLSQYLMRVQSCGSLPPQESGLLSNSWFGKFHYEMIFWHAAHFGAWGRRALSERQLEVYFKALAGAKARAKEQGYAGARWFKCSGDTLMEWPHIIHATLIWQQPHPIWFAEQAYGQNPSDAVLKKYAETVFETAEFMASLPVKDSKGVYNIVSPVTIVSENNDRLQTRNPAFELAYWRYGLRVALQWQKRMGLPESKKWREVLENLAPLPVENGVYITHEGLEDMWTKMNFEHPALIGVYGVLCGDGVDREVFKRTLEKVLDKWNFERVWGWDFPMLSMACARVGLRDKAVDMLLFDSKNFRFDIHGIATGGPCAYFPSNGGLLLAAAYLAYGRDGKGLFPESWRVKAEGFPKYE